MRCRTRASRATAAQEVDVTLSARGGDTGTHGKKEQKVEVTVYTQRNGVVRVEDVEANLYAGGARRGRGARGVGVLRPAVGRVVMGRRGCTLTHVSAAPPRLSPAQPSTSCATSSTARYGRVGLHIAPGAQAGAVRAGCAPSFDASTCGRTARDDGTAWVCAPHSSASPPSLPSPAGAREGARHRRGPLAGPCGPQGGCGGRGLPGVPQGGAGALGDAGGTGGVAPGRGGPVSASRRARAGSCRGSRRALSLLSWPTWAASAVLLGPQVKVEVEAFDKEEKLKAQFDELNKAFPAAVVRSKTLVLGEAAATAGKGSENRRSAGAGGAGAGGGECGCSVRDCPLPSMAPKRSASTSPEPSTSSSDASSDSSSDGERRAPGPADHSVGSHIAAPQPPRSQPRQAFQ
jgi:hypothetical protein